MYKLTLILAIAILASCGESSDNELNRPSVPNQPQKAAAQDLPIAYFLQQGHSIRIIKKFEFNFSNAHFRGVTFHYGKKIQANEQTGDGRGCTIVQPLTTTDMGPILVQSLANMAPIGRDVLGREVPDDFRFYGIKFDFTVVGSGFLYCFRHETLGPIIFEDFRDHFQGHLEFL